MSIVALSDSRVSSGSSTATVSPGPTCTSITGMSWKSPMSGIRISMAMAGAPCDKPTYSWRGRRASARSVRVRRSSAAVRARGSQQQPADVDQQVAQVAGEPGRECAVHDPMVVRQRQGQHQSRNELLAVPDRGRASTDNPEDGHFRSVHDRGETGATDPAEARDGEGAALHVRSGQLAVPGLGGQHAQLLADLGDALAVGVLD